MSQPLPAPAPACSLSAADGANRAARWRALIDAELLSRTTTAVGERLAFRANAAVAVELDALVAAERDCCPFLTLRVERADRALVLDVSGPADAMPIVEAMFGTAP